MRTYHYPVRLSEEQHRWLETMVHLSSTPAKHAPFGAGTADAPPDNIHDDGGRHCGETRCGERDYLSLTLSVNHDIVDGAPAARFTQRLKELIESGYGLFDSTVESEQARAEGVSKQQVDATRNALP